MVLEQKVERRLRRRIVQYRLPQFLTREHILREEGGEFLRHLVLTAQEEALQRERAYSHRIDRLKNPLQRQPIGT